MENRHNDSSSISSASQGTSTQDLHPLLLPEVLLQIGPRLNQVTVLRCLLVCQTWNACLTPFLFQRVNLPKRRHHFMGGSSPGSGGDEGIRNNKRAPRPMISALQLNAAHIRTLICADNNIILRQITPRCIAVETLVLGKITSEILPILNRCKDTLVRLVFTPQHSGCVPNVSQYAPSSASRYGDQHTEPESTEILEAILRLSKLQHLVLDYLGLVNLGQLRLLFQFFQQLTSLELHNNAVLRRTPDDLGFFQLRSVSIVNSHMSIPDQLWFLQCCPLLEHITCICESSAVGMQLLSSVGNLVLTDGARRRRHELKSLDISNCSQNDDCMARALSEFRYLEELVVRNTLIGNGTLREVLKRQDHENQIRVLDIADCMAVSPEMVNSILLSCTGLRSLTADRIRAMDLIEKPTFRPLSSSTSSLAPIVTSPTQRRADWACLELEELRVVFVGPAILFTPSEVQRAVYDQIAKLSHLRVLSLGRNASMKRYAYTSILDLSLANGMAQLAPLKDLEEFDFCQMHHRLGMPEVKFMLGNWPKVAAMHGHLHSEDVDRAAFMESYVRNERPGIKLKHHLKYRRNVTRTMY